MLEIKNLSKQYKTKQVIVDALIDINLKFGSRGFIVLTGKSGSGKSTLLNLLGGLDRFDQGEIIIKNKSTKQFQGRDWDSYRNTYVGFVFQEFYLIDEFTIGKNIALALELQGFDAQQIEGQVIDILKQVDLEGFKNRLPNELSGGQKQRIAIARALIKNPQIILCDEPTGNLDSETGKMILETLKELSKTKLVIMVTHEINFARSYGDRIIELKDGQIINDVYSGGQLNKETIHEGNDVFKNVIDIPLKHKISTDIIDYINQLAMSADEDLLITISEADFVKDCIDLSVTHENQDLIDFLNEENNDEFYLKKTSLSFRNTLKLALSSLLGKKFRFVLMSLLFIFALSFVGVALSLSFYDTTVTTIKTFEKEKVKTIPFSITAYECRQGYCYYNDKSITIDDFNDLASSYKNLTLYQTVYTEIELADLAPIVEPEERSTYHKSFFNRIAIIDEQRLPLRYGDQISNTNEILVTDYMADMFIYYQIFDLSNTVELINKEIVYNEQTYIIKGIVKTDYEKYDYLKSEPDNYRLFYQSTFDIDFYQLYALLFMSEETYQNNFVSDIVSLNFNDVNSQTSTSKIIKASKVNTDNLVGELPNAENEIVLTSSYIKNILNETREINKVIGSIYSFSYNYSTSRRAYGCSFHTKTKEYQVVGVIEDNDSNTDNYDIILLDSEFNYIDLNSPFSNSYRTVNAILGDNLKENREFIIQIEKNHYHHETIYSEALTQLKEITDTVNTVLLIIGGVFSLFASILIFSFIASSINRKQKDIGTLRALGATGWDIGRIFMTEGLMIIIFSSILATAISGITLSMLNNHIIKKFNFDIVIFYINPKAIICLFVLAIFIMVLSSFIPIRRISRMKPINAIKIL